MGAWPVSLSGCGRFDRGRHCIMSSIHLSCWVFGVPFSHFLAISVKSTVYLTCLQGHMPSRMMPVRHSNAPSRMMPIQSILTGVKLGCLLSLYKAPALCSVSVPHAFRPPQSTLRPSFIACLSHLTLPPGTTFFL